LCGSESTVAKHSDFVPLRMKRRGVETRIIAAGDDRPRKVDPALLRRWRVRGGSKCSRTKIGRIERRSGVVIHISSIAHRMPFSNSTLAYAAGKGALSTYSKGLARGVANSGVRVTRVSHSFIETSFAHGMIMDISKGTGVSEEAARRSPRYGV
jgi:NAD(P)-dependent dehydrogenase (short-subunit alcohol dehydrogenase family)